MTEHLTLGPVPYLEICAKVGNDGYRDQALRECRAYIEAIRKKLGPEPEGAALRVKAFAHDFGTYYEAVCTFDPAHREATEYAHRCEAEAPATWDEVGMKAPGAGPRRRRG